MSDELIAVLWAVGLVIAWSGVCGFAGAIWDATRRMSDRRDRI